MSRARSLANLANSGVFSADATQNRVGINSSAPTKTLDVVGDGRVSGTLSIGGTINYEDVTSIDSIGVVTARDGVHIVSAGASIYSPATNELAFYTNGSERVRVNDVGRVAIGTNNPGGANLAIVSPGNASFSIGQRVDGTGQNHLGMYYGNIGAANTAANIFTSNGDMNFWVDGAQAPTSSIRFGRTFGADTWMTMLSSGNIGIGTETPRDLVHIFHPTNNVNLLIESGDANSYLAFKDNATTSDAAVYLGAEGNNLKFITSAAERLRITSAGLVGIGTDNPSTGLHLLGLDSYLTMQSSASDGNAGILFKDNTGAQNAVVFYDFDDDFLKFSTNNDTEALRINSTGLVGIGTDNPSELLHLESGYTKQILKSTNLNTASSLIFDTHNVTTADFLLGQVAGRWNGNDVAYINFEAGSDTTNDDDGVITFLTSESGSSPTERLRITSSGQINSSGPIQIQNGAIFASHSRSYTASTTATGLFGLQMTTGHGFADLTWAFVDSSSPNGVRMGKIFLTFRGSGTNITAVTITSSTESSISSGTLASITWTASVGNVSNVRLNATASSTSGNGTLYLYGTSPFFSGLNPIANA